MRFLMIFCSMLVVSSCFSTFPGLYTPLKMTYTSNPAGAMVYQGSILLGYAPVQVEYSWSLAAQSPDKCMNLQPITVRWASGAEASISSLRSCTSAGYLQQFSFVRPKEYPGRELDVQFAMQQQQFALMQQQAAAQERAMLFNYLLQQNSAPPQSISLSCQSREVNGTVFTDCR